MGKKVMIPLAVAVVVAGGIYLYNKKQAQAPNQEAGQTKSNGSEAAPKVTEQTGTSTQNTASSSPNTRTQVKGGTGPDYSPGHYSTGEEGVGAEGADVQVVEINYDGSQFTPSSVSIKAGDYVIFKNKSTQTFWPASNPHPTHTGYPGFDADKALGPGKQYQFKFDKAGKWNFHDHLNPSVHGTVNVTQ